MIANWLQTAIVAAAVGALSYGGGYLLGKRDGRNDAATDALAATVQVLTERGKIDADISSSDAVRLCDHYGLSEDDKRECVRRVEEANTKGGNGNTHND